jgi:hypothetical protein
MRLRAGSLAIKAPYGRVGAHQQPRTRTVPLEASVTATWNLLGISARLSLRYRARPSVSSVPPPCAFLGSSDVLVP